MVDAFCRKKVFSHDTIWWYQFFGNQFLSLFSFRAFTQSFLSRSCDELFLSKQWTMFLHMVVSKILKFYERNDLWLQHKSWDVQVVCVRDPFTWNLQCAWVQCIFRFVKCYRNFAHLLVRLCPPNYYWHPRIFRPSDGPGKYAPKNSIIKRQPVKRYQKFMTSFCPTSPDQPKSARISSFVS